MTIFAVMVASLVGVFAVGIALADRLLLIKTMNRFVREAIAIKKVTK